MNNITYKIINIFLIIYKTIRLLVAIAINFAPIWIFITSDKLTTKIAIIPFMICTLSILGATVSSIIKKDKFIPLFSNIFFISILLYWFGFLIFMNYRLFKNQEYNMILFTVPFWIIGIFLFYKKIIKRKQHKKLR